MDAMRAQGFYIGDVSNCGAAHSLFGDGVHLNWPSAGYISGSEHKRQRLVFDDLKKPSQQVVDVGVRGVFDYIDHEVGYLLSRLQLMVSDPQYIRCINNGSTQRVHSDVSYSAITKDGLRSLHAGRTEPGRGREFSLFITGPEGGRFCVYLPKTNVPWFEYGERLTSEQRAPELNGWQLYCVTMPPWAFCLLWAAVLHAGGDALPTRVFAYLRRSGRTRSHASAYEQKTHYISEINQTNVLRTTDLPDVSERE